MGDNEVIKKVLSLQYKVFQEQLTEFHQQLRDYHFTHRIDPLDTKVGQAPLIPVLEGNDFENRLVGLLSRNKGIRKDAADSLRELADEVKAKSDMSTVQRERIALICAVVRNTDIMTEYVTFIIKGGGDVLIRWLRAAYHAMDFSLVEHITACFEDKKLEAVFKQKQFEFVQKLIESLDACAKIHTGTDSTANASSTTSCLGFWLSNLDVATIKKNAVKKCVTLKSQCTALMKGGSITREVKAKEIKRPRVVETSVPKPINQSMLNAAKPSGSVKSGGVNRVKSRQSQVSVQNILSGERPAAIAPPVSAMATTTSQSGNVAMTASSSVAMYSGYYTLSSSSAVVDSDELQFVPYRYDSNEYNDTSEVGGKRKRNSSGRSVRWADCREAGQLCEVKLFVTEEPEEDVSDVTRSLVGPPAHIINAPEDDEVEGDARFQRQNDLNKELQYMQNHKRPKYIASTLQWHIPAPLAFDHLSEDAVRATVDSKEFKVQTLRLAKLDALPSSTGQISSLTGIVVIDPEEPPKETVIERKRIQTLKEEMVVVSWTHFEEVEPPISQESSELLALIEMLPEYVREMDPHHLEVLLEALMQEENMHLLGDMDSDEFRLLVRRIQYFGENRK